MRVSSLPPYPPAPPFLCLAAALTVASHEGGSARAARDPTEEDSSHTISPDLTALQEVCARET